MSGAYIEKLARVIWDGDSHDPEARGYSWGEAIESVRAILTAGLEPSERMVKTADEQLDWGPPGYDNAPQGAAYPEIALRVMLQAALDET